MKYIYNEFLYRTNLNVSPWCNTTSLNSQTRRTCCQNWASKYILSFLKSQSMECIACTSASGAAGRLAAPVGCIRMTAVPVSVPTAYWLHYKANHKHLCVSQPIFQMPSNGRLLIAILFVFTDTVACRNRVFSLQVSMFLIVLRPDCSPKVSKEK